jgi:hypothetical protein
MANTIAPHERAQNDSAMGPMRKGGMRFASASDRVSVGLHAVSYSQSHVWVLARRQRLPHAAGGGRARRR